MGDVFTRSQHYERNSDALAKYLISDTIRMMLLYDSSLDFEKLKSDLFLLYLEDVNKLIEYHKGISHTLEEYLMKESLNNESKGPTI